MNNSNTVIENTFNNLTYFWGHFFNPICCVGCRSLDNTKICFNCIVN